MPVPVESAAETSASCNSRPAALQLGPPRVWRAPRSLQRVWEGVFLGRPAVIKQRFSKKYRHPTLDAKLTVQRLKGVRPGPLALALSPEGGGAVTAS